MEIKPNVTRVYICDTNHPHHGETGVMTGKAITLFGKVMAEMKLEDCKHATDACYVRRDQVTARGLEFQQGRVRS